MQDRMLRLGSGPTGWMSARKIGSMIRWATTSHNKPGSACAAFGRSGETGASVVSLEAVVGIIEES